MLGLAAYLGTAARKVSTPGPPAVRLLPPRVSQVKATTRLLLALAK